MKTYFITEKLTREAMMTVVDAPDRGRGVVEFARSMGVNILEFFYCMSQFDFIMKVEAPDDETVTAFCMAAERSGNVTCEVTRAFTPDEWEDMTKRLP